MAVPTHLSYSAEHEWVDLGEGDLATVGITEYAAEALGDIVFVELPEAGTTIVAGEVCGEVESTKSVSDLYAPIDGEVVEINTALTDDPGLVNTDSFGDGWLFRVKVHGTTALLTAEAYDELIEGS